MIVNTLYKEFGVRETLKDLFRQGLFRGCVSRCAFVCALPRSGSLYFANKMSQVLGYRVANPCLHFGDVYPEMDAVRYRRVVRKRVVCWTHLVATRKNVDWWSEFSVKPLVLVRNPVNAVLSAGRGVPEERGRSWAGFEGLPSNFERLVGDDRVSCLIDCLLPKYLWWLDQWVEWKDCALDFVRYEDWSDDSDNLALALSSVLYKIPGFKRYSVNPYEAVRSDKKEDLLHTSKVHCDWSTLPDDLRLRAEAVLSHPWKGLEIFGYAAKV